MLNIILKRAGLVTGPRRKHTSHSSMEVIKKDLCGLPQFKGNEDFLKFGNAVHEGFLEGDYTNAYKRLGKDEQRLVDVMVKKLNSHPVVASLMRESIREHKFAVVMNKVKVVVILDSKQPKLKRGFDLKTTSERTQKDFEEKIRKLGYVKQGRTYMYAAGLEQFYFVGIQKERPHNIYIVDIRAPQFKEHYKYAEQELKFLLYFYKHYGKTTIIRLRTNANATDPQLIQSVRKGENGRAKKTGSSAELDKNVSKKRFGVACGAARKI